ncbi:amino acid--tRNA ligase-related protein [Candidatus Vidania fulgoroideorum]
MKRTILKHIKNKLNNIVKIYGWVDVIRNMGKIVFLIIRDIDCKVQVVLKKEIFKKHNIKKNYCVEILGKVITSYNKKIELHCNSIKLINKSDYYNINEKQKNRVLYLKKEKTKNILKKKSLIYQNVRIYLNKINFIEVETPILTKKTIEGAKCFKIEKKNIYLSQSPQVYKQMLMIAEYDRYFQFAKCFRDEEYRSDRQKEFTQIDLEMSFPKISNIISITNKIIEIIFDIFNIKYYNKLVIKKYKKVIMMYGTDKPDTRIKLKWKKISKKAFYINLPNISKEIKVNKKKVFLFRVNKKTFNKYKINLYKYKLRRNYLIMIYKKKIYPKIMEYIIKKFAFSKEGKGYFKNDINIVCVKEFPMFKYKKKCYHHQFTKFKNIKKRKKDIRKKYLLIKSYSYDFIINGIEVAGGSVRINNFKQQKKLFEILKIKKYFKEFLKNMKYATPKHGGIAIGLDRIIKIIANLKSIRNCISFLTPEKV